jgi:hypothetical protein
MSAARKLRRRAERNLGEEFAALAKKTLGVDDQQIAAAKGELDDVVAARILEIAQLAIGSTPPAVAAELEQLEQRNGPDFLASVASMGKPAKSAFAELYLMRSSRVFGGISLRGTLHHPETGPYGVGSGGWKKWHRSSGSYAVFARRSTSRRSLVTGCGRGATSSSAPESPSKSSCSGDGGAFTSEASPMTIRTSRLSVPTVASSARYGHEPTGAWCPA